MNLANTLRRISLGDPQRPALYEGTRLVCTYAACFEETNNEET